MKLIVCILVAVACRLAIGISPETSEAIRIALDRAIAEPMERDEAIAELTKRVAIDELTQGLANAVKSRGDYHTRGTATKFLRSLKPYPAERLIGMAAAAQHPIEKLFLLNSLSIELPANDARVQKLLADALYDKRVGMRAEGSEEQAYSPVGLRVCDFAYNAIQSKRSEAPPPEFPLDTANDPVSKRDQLIIVLCSKLGIPAPEPSSNAPTSAVQPGSLMSPAISPTARPSSPRDKNGIDSTGISSTPWSIIVVLIVAAGGLLWLLLKRRS